MDAKEARKITESNIPPFENIEKSIQERAAYGESYVCVPRVVEAYQNKLISSGFKVSSYTDPMGFDFTKIEW